MLQAARSDITRLVYNSFTGSEERHAPALTLHELVLSSILPLFVSAGGAQIQWVVACFDSMEEFESDSSPLSPSLAISFPSPLLSCLAEEEVGCKGSDCIVMPDGKPSLYHSPTSSCSNPTPHECCAEQKQECSSEGFFLKCSPYQVPPTPSSFLPGDTPLFVSNERSDELSPKEYPLQCHLQEEEGSQKLTCEAFPFSPLSVDCSPSCEDSWLNLDFSESSDQQYTK
jgi:hypothetical protein